MITKIECTFCQDTLREIKFYVEKARKFKTFNEKYTFNFLNEIYEKEAQNCLKWAEESMLELEDKLRTCPNSEYHL